MAHNPFDVSAKELIWDGPADWLRRLGIDHYRVVRLWKEDPEDYLNAGISVVPLAPLTDVPRADLPGVVRRMCQRIDTEPEPRAEKLHATAYFLMGLRYSDDLAEHLMGGTRKMRGSSTYEKVLNDGRLEEARKLLLRHGARRLGTPDAAVTGAVEAISNLDRLEALTDRIFDEDVRDWGDLLRGKRPKNPGTAE